MKKQHFLKKISLAQQAFCARWRSSIALACAIIALILPFNSAAFAKNIYNPQAGFSISHISVMPNQTSVRAISGYIFTRKAVLLRISIGGMNFSTFKSVRKFAVNVGKYRVVNAQAALSKIANISCAKNFQYQRSSNEAVISAELNAEGIYDLRDVTVSFNAANMNPVNITSKNRNNMRREDLRFIVIDSTSPRLSVNYDNKKSYEGKYFREKRSARIVIQDNSFAFSKIFRDTFPIAQVFENGKKVLEITAQNFKNDASNPNIWYSDVAFSRDATWDVQYGAQDLCGNVASSLRNNFVIDTNPPTVTISGVKNGGAYAHDVAPSIVIKDAWLKPESVTYSLIKMQYSKNLRIPASLKSSNQSVSAKYANFYHGSKDDGVYELSWSAKDVVDHAIHGILQFSMNSSGSTFSIDSSTSEMNNKQLKNAKDVHIEELNLSGLANPAKVSVIKDGVEKVLSKNDFSVSKRLDKGFQHLSYTIFQRNFSDNANYRVRIASVDKAGNHSFSDSSVKTSEGVMQASASALQFTVDHLAPLTTVFNMRNNATYKSSKEGKLLRISAKDNASLKSVKVSIDGKTRHIWHGKAANKPMLSMKIKPDSICHDVLVEALDYAGNVTTVKYSNVKVVPIEKNGVKISDSAENENSADTENGSDAEKSDKANKNNKNNKNNKDNKANKNLDSEKSSEDSEWIAKSQVQNPENISIKEDSLQKKSANSLSIIAYVGVAVTAVLCAFLGIGMLHNKRSRSRKLILQ